MLRWNSPTRPGLLFLLLLLGPAAIGAQSAATAILRRGPEPVRGIPYLPPNALKGFRGEYVVGLGVGGGPSPAAPGAAGDQLLVEVYFTRQRLVVPEGWSSSRCGALALSRVSGEERYTLCYREEQAYAVFFGFPDPDPPPVACRFVEGFLRRFQILLGFQEAGREPPFPAVLQLGDQ